MKTNGDQPAFSRAEAQHLRWLVQDEIECGTYYGRKDQHAARQKRLIEKLDSMLAQEADDDSASGNKTIDSGPGRGE